MITLRHTSFCLSTLLFSLAGCSAGGGGSSAQNTPDTSDNTDDAVETTTVKDGTVVETAALVSLGEKLFNDTSLSVPAGQGCVSCHDPAAGFTDPDSGDPTSQGADGASIGTRNAPTASYAAFIPDRQTISRIPAGETVPVDVLIGGQFLDGRAESLEEQARAPFLNPVEMANASESDVIDKVRTASYADDFEALFGTGVLDDVDKSYAYIADAIAAFERSDTFSPFTSKFDQVAAGNAVFTVQEANGKALFDGKADCIRCHRTPGGGTDFFSSFEYFNIGVPANAGLESNLGSAVDDKGLGGTDNGTSPGDDGKFRVPTLRNIANTAPYMHNGVFTSLTEVVEFYNTRDEPTTTFDPPEVAANVFQPGSVENDMGNLKLTTDEIADIVAFMQTFSDQP